MGYKCVDEVSVEVYITCDVCGIEDIFHDENADDALDSALDGGWKVEGPSCLCPDCAGSHVICEECGHVNSLE